MYNVTHTDNMTSHQDLPKAQSNKTNKDKNEVKSKYLTREYHQPQGLC